MFIHWLKKSSFKYKHNSVKCEVSPIQSYMYIYTSFLVVFGTSTIRIIQNIYLLYI